MATISELMSDIYHQNLVLPEFQREYVWTPEQAKQLMVSLFRGYPTGSLLFWKTANPPALKHSSDLKKTSIPQERLGAISVILDGQQRLTTLYLLIKDQIPPYYRQVDIKTDPRDLYFDLHSGEYQYYQTSRMKSNPTWVRVTDCLAATNPVKVFEIAQKKVVDGKVADDLASLANLYNDNLTKLRNILEKDYPIQIVPPSADIDAAIDVFDRVNSLGTKLTDAELALTHVTGKWARARDVMKDKISNLKARGFAFDLTFMTRCLVGVVHGRALYEVIHRTDGDQIQAGWTELTKILDYLVTILSGSAFIHSTDDLSTTNVLVPVVVYLARHEKKFPDDKELKRFIHWMYAANMWGRYSSQTDQKLDHDISIVQRSDSPWKELVDAIIEQRGRIEVKPSDLEGRGIQNPLYRMMFIISKTRDAVDWFNGSHLRSSYGHVINNRYVFSGTLLYKSEKYNSANHLHKKLVTEIANRFFLTDDSGSGLGDTAPANYLAQVEQKYPGALTKQFIPPNQQLWHVEFFEDFLVARRKLIVDAINNYMQKLIAEPEPEPSYKIEDLLAAEESASLEYKSSLCWDVRQQKMNPELRKMIFKTIAGFLNVEGGMLLIGVADDGTILGVEHDLNHKPTLMNATDRDKFGQLFQAALLDYVGAEFNSYIHLSLEEYKGHTVALVKVDPSSKPVYVYVKDKDHTEFYIRAGNTTKILDIESALNYISMHWES